MWKIHGFRKNLFLKISIELIDAFSAIIGVFCGFFFLFLHTLSFSHSAKISSGFILKFFLGEQDSQVYQKATEMLMVLKLWIYNPFEIYATNKKYNE